MNDRFKFRVWCKECKEWEKDQVAITNKENYIINFSDQNFTRVTNIDPVRHEINFCTGLKDKNGKLIYEGDIVRYAEYEIDDIEPEWEYDEIVWGGKYSYPAFDLANNQFECNGLSYIINEGWTIEVIGNKFENLELLKECK